MERSWLEPDCPKSTELNAPAEDAFRDRPSTVNPSAIIALTPWDFSSYPKSYPRQSRAGVGPLGIGWARMSSQSPSGRHSRFCQFSRDAAIPPALTRLQGTQVFTVMNRPLSTEAV